MIGFLSTHAGLIGLLFFFAFFCVMFVWVYRPDSNKIYKNYAHIPLKEND